MLETIVFVLGVIAFAGTTLSVHHYKKIKKLEKTIETLLRETQIIEKTIREKPILKVKENSSKEEIERQIMLLHFKGYSIRQIARSVGKSKSYVHKIIKKNKEIVKQEKKKKKEAIVKA